jgi:hypothetical protein
MRILFFKSLSETRRGDADNEPTGDKMRRILESHVDEAKTAEDRERAEKALRDFTGAGSDNAR